MHLLLFVLLAVNERFGNADRVWLNELGSTPVSEDFFQCTQPIKCAPFPFSVNGVGSYTHCTVLNAGRFGLAGNSYCVTKKNVVVNCDVVAKKDCLNGKEVNITGNQCPPGLYWDEQVKKSCVPCLIGNYCPGNDTMVQCPQGYEARFRGMRNCTRYPSNILSQDYFFQGSVSYSWGDPHQGMWNGKVLNYQGIAGEQYYFVTRCAHTPVDWMPFNVIGSHFGKKVTYLTGGVTIELFERSGNQHTVSLGDGSASSGSISFSSMKRALYDGNKPGRFALMYQRSKKKLYLYIDNKLVTQLTFSFHYYGTLRMTPPKGVESTTCGLFGDFKNTGFQMESCSGSILKVSNKYDYSFGGLTWSTTRCKRGVNVIADETSYTGAPPLAVVSDVKNNPCKAGSHNAIVAKKECDLQHAKYKKLGFCTGVIETQLCQKLVSECYVDACVVGAQKAKKSAGAFGQSLAVWKKDEAMLRVELNPARVKPPKKALFVCGMGGLAPIRNRKRTRKQMGVTTTRIRFNRILGCKKVVLVAYLSGFDVNVGRKASAVVSVTGQKMLGKVNANVVIKSSMNKQVYAVAPGLVGACAEAQLRVLSVKGNGNKVLTRTVTNMKCPKRNLKIVSGVNSMSWKSKAATKTAFEVMTRIAGTTANSASVTVQFVIGAASQIGELSAAVMVYCAAKKSGMGPERIQSGEIGFSGAKVASKKSNVKSMTRRVKFAQSMLCVEPRVLLTLKQVDVGVGTGINARVVQNTVTPFGFSMVVEMFHVLRVGQFTVGYVAMCS